MERNLISVISGIIIVILFMILTGLSLIPLEIAMWLPFVGLLLCSLIIGWGGTHRTAFLLVYSFLIYMGLMLFLAANGTLLSDFVFGPLSFSQIQNAWTSFQTFVNTIPFLPLLSNLAFLIRTTLGDSLLAIFLEFLVASLFTGFIAFLVTGITGHFTRPEGLHVVTAPEAPSDLPEAPLPLAPAPAPSPTPVAAPSSPAMPTPPPPMPAPQPVEEALPPPPPISNERSPSAQAIATLKGKVDKHLKSTGQEAPAGQSRCPHCQATIIQGSRFCNACQREI